MAHRLLFTIITEVCGFCQILFKQFFPSAKENAAKQEPHQRAAVKNLPEKRHWEIADDGAEPLIDKIQAEDRKSVV